MAKQFATIPVVDLKGLIAGADQQEKLCEVAGSRRELLAAQLKAALQEYGTCYVINHGIPLPMVKRLQTQCKRYFQQPQEEKRKHHLDMLPQDKHGEEGYLREGFHTKDHTEVVDGETKSMRARETLSFYAWPSAIRTEDLWPESIKKELSIYSSSLRDLTLLLLGLLAESLGIPPTSFVDAIGNDEVQLVSLHHYPTLAGWAGDASDTFGLRPHLDTTLLTVLLLDEVEGLQVVENGEWLDVQPVEGALLVQTGVLIQTLTNDLIKAKLHQVKTPSAPRISVISGTRLPTVAIVEPLCHLVGSATPALFTPFCVGDYFAQMAQGGYFGTNTLDNFRVGTRELIADSLTEGTF